jgi:hypothetical protein
MPTPNIPLFAEKRVTFDETIARMGINLTGATLACEIRNRPGDSGTPLITLGNASAPTQGLSISYDSGFPDPLGKLPNGASLLRIIISEATLEGLAYAADPAQIVTLSYDIHVTPSGGGTKFVFASGAFIVNPGVTL